MTAFDIGSPTSLWEVFLLFFIPGGGGIPAGVILAKSRAMGWLTMTLLYLVSDIILACLFEPILRLFIWGSERNDFLARLREALRKTNNRLVSGYGANPGPLMLVVIAFGVDPMTGRAAAMAAGHSFISGWAIAILGDMFFFGLIAVSTLALNNVLGDGTWAAVIVMLAMAIIPAIFRRLKKVKKEADVNLNK